MTMILFSAGIERAGRSSRLPDRSGSLDASMQLTKYRWIRSIFWISVLDNVTINQLRAFVAVCDQGSFSGAARKLGRAQSAISHAVKALESAFDEIGRASCRERGCQDVEFLGVEVFLKK